MTAKNCTAVILSYRKNRHNHRLLFGSPEVEIRRGWHRKLAVFSPHRLFAYERWEANQFGTQRWEIFVCRTGIDGSLTKVQGVIPAAELLLNVQGKTKTKRLLSVLDQLKNSHINLENIADRYWSELHSSFEAGSKTRLHELILEAQTSC